MSNIDLNSVLCMLGCWDVDLPNTKQIVFALNSWNYCSGEQVQQSNIFQVSLVSILQVGDWARVHSGRHYFSTYVTTTDCHQNPVQHAVMGLSE